MEEDADRPVVARAPGRVNLIGEHTDYQGGYVLPFAVQLGITLRARPESDGVIRLTSERVPEPAEFRVGEDPGAIEPDWARYPAAVLDLLGSAGLEMRGLSGRIESDLPVGVGLASSAALTVATALAAVGISRSAGGEVPAPLLERRRLAELCRDAEAKAAGVRCGLMDPYASLCCREGEAILLDCREGTHEVVSLERLEAAFLVIDSGVSRHLGDGRYNRRRGECEAAMERVRENGCEAASARDIPLGDVASVLLPLSDLHRNRVRHQVTENARTLSARIAVETGDAGRLGTLLTSSHESLRDDYEVSCEALDALVSAAAESPGIYGSRLMGAGFGGSVLAVASERAVDEACAAVITGYRERTGRTAEIHRVIPSTGAVLRGVPLT